MKLLFIVDHLKGGGAERITLELMEQLHIRGIDVACLVLGDDEMNMSMGFDIPMYYANLSQEFFDGGMWRKRKYKPTEQEIKNVKKYIELINPSKIILGYWHGYFIEPFLPKTIETILWFHGQAFDLKRKKTKNLFRWYKEARRVYLERRGFVKIAGKKRIIFVNDDLRTECLSYLNSDDLFVLPNGVNIPKITTLAGEELGKKWDCIFVGRLSQEKQPEHAITAFASSGLMGRMAIVGDGQMKGELVALCKNLNVDGRIDFLGWQENPYPFIQQSKVLVLSSKMEGFGLVVSEALVLDVNVVSYNVSSGVYCQLSQNQLVEGLVENQNLEMLANKLYQVVNSPYAITNEDKNRLSIEKMTENFIKIIG